jgi:hypothetical protein
VPIAIGLLNVTMKLLLNGLIIDEKEMIHEINGILSECMFTSFRFREECTLIIVKEFGET